MKIPKTKLIAGFICLFLVVIITSACTKVDPPTEGSSGDQQLNIPIEISNPASFRPNALRVASPISNRRFHPLYARDQVELWVVDLVFESLLKVNAEGEFIPEIAESYTVDASRRVVTFQLKRDVFFHDNHLLSPEDVVFTYELLRNAEDNAGYGSFFDNLLKVEALSDEEVRFVFSTPDINCFWGFTAAILPKHVYSDVEEEELPAAIGTGVMKLAENNGSNDIVLEKSNNHHSKVSGIDRITFMTVSAERGMELFANGSVDLIYLPPSEVFKNSLADVSFGKAFESPSNTLITIGLNHQNEILNDRNVRQALMFASNREQFVMNEWPVGSELAYGPLGENHFTQSPDQAINVYSYDSEKAKRLLEESGWLLSDNQSVREKEGQPLQFELYAFNDVSWSYNLALHLKSEWEAIGVDLKINFTDFNQLKDTVFNEQAADAWTMAWHLPPVFDQASLFGASASRPGGYNAGSYSHPFAENMFSQIKTATSLEETRVYTAEWLSFANEDLPVLFIAFPGELWGVNQRVSNWRTQPYYPWTQVIEEIRLDYLN